MHVHVCGVKGVEVVKASIEAAAEEPQGAQYSLAVFGDDATRISFGEFSRQELLEILAGAHAKVLAEPDDPTTKEEL